MDNREEGSYKKLEGVSQAIDKSQGPSQGTADTAGHTAALQQTLPGNALESLAGTARQNTGQPSIQEALESNDEVWAIVYGETHCPIKLGAYEIGDVLRQLPCNHKLHLKCVDQWLKRSANCPICKHPLDRRWT